MAPVDVSGLAHRRVTLFAKFGLKHKKTNGLGGVSLELSHLIAVSELLLTKLGVHPRLQSCKKVLMKYY